MVTYRAVTRKEGFHPVLALAVAGFASTAWLGCGAHGAPKAAAQPPASAPAPSPPEAAPPQPFGEAVTPAPPPRSPDETEEYEVLSALLLDQFFAGAKPDEIVLVDSTASGELADQKGERVRSFERVLGVEGATAQDFVHKNEAPVRLASGFTLPARVELVGRRDIAEYLKDTEGWTVFSARYPTAPGITVLSRVGFNDAHTEALVVLGNWSHAKIASSLAAVLKRAPAGGWTVRKKSSLFSR
jgi:hypothetical protein